MVIIDRQRLLKQLKEDEGFTPKAYWDVRQWTIGYGGKAYGKDDTITEEIAASKLDVRVRQSETEFYEMFPGALQDKFNDVRAEAFINILYNMGKGSIKHPDRGGLYSFTNTLSLIYDYLEVDWSAVASGLAASLWSRQVGQRATRIVEEIKTGVKKCTQ